MSRYPVLLPGRAATVQRRASSLILWYSDLRASEISVFVGRLSLLFKSKFLQNNKDRSYAVDSSVKRGCTK